MIIYKRHIRAHRLPQRGKYKEPTNDKVQRCMRQIPRGSKGHDPNETGELVKDDTGEPKGAELECH